MYRRPPRSDQPWNRSAQSWDVYRCQALLRALTRPRVSEPREPHHGTELRRHRPSRPAAPAVRRAPPARGVSRLRVRMDVRLADPVARVLPAADHGRRGDESHEVRALRDEPGDAGTDGHGEWVRHAARHLRRSNGDGDRQGRFGTPRDRLPAREDGRVRALARDDQGPHERPESGVERARSSS